jgi:hypothetical protein
MLLTNAIRLGRWRLPKVPIFRSWCTSSDASHDIEDASCTLKCYAVSLACLASDANTRSRQKIRLTCNSVSRNKIPLASETNRGFMFDNKKLNWTRCALVIRQ